MGEDLCGLSQLLKAIAKVRHTAVCYHGEAVGCFSAVMGFAQPSVGPGVHWLTEVLCVPETEGQITRCYSITVC